MVEVGRILGGRDLRLENARVQPLRAVMLIGIAPDADTNPAQRGRIVAGQFQRRAQVGGGFVVPG